MTTNDEQYVPSDEDVRSVWVVHERDCGWEPHPGDPSAEFDRFLARVRRDAIDGLIAWHRENAQDAETPAPVRRGIAVMADEAQRYRDTLHPEETS